MITALSCVLHNYRRHQVVYRRHPLRDRRHIVWERRQQVLSRLDNGADTDLSIGSQARRQQFLPTWSLQVVQFQTLNEDISITRQFVSKAVISTNLKIW